MLPRLGQRKIVCPDPLLVQRPQQVLGHPGIPLDSLRKVHFIRLIIANHITHLRY